MDNKRFMRTELLIGVDAMDKIKASTVMIVGLGAVGGYALEAVARFGVGHLILIDFDSFDETNINRQILALTSTIGKKKIEVALDRVKQINPDCKVEVMDCFVDASNIKQILACKPDFVIDAIDSLKPKCELIKALIDENIEFISSMGAALKKSADTIKITTLNKTQNCSMARVMRHNLKKMGVDIKKVDCVFSDEQCELDESAICKNEAGKKQILGSLPTITAIFGLMMANYMMNKLLKTVEKKFC